MRLAPTSESVLWQAIRGRRHGLQFRRQVPLGGRYIADFLSSELGLVIEIEVGTPRVCARSDERRTRWLERCGYTVLRLSDALVLRELAAAVALVAERVTALRKRR
jgi:very-short-patch-repair endonuclease